MKGISSIGVAVVVAILALAGAASAHDTGRKKPKSTKATADLKAARAATDAAKARLAREGKYSCCTKPTCDMCVRTHGACTCAADVAAGRGACGECVGNWKAGKGALSGVKAEDVAVAPSCHGGGHAPDSGPDMTVAREALDGAKRTLVSEGAYTCCMKGGCGMCAREGYCPCGKDLAADLAPPADGKKPSAKKRGVCGECYDAWRSGQGAFAGVSPDEVALADMDAEMRTAAGGPYRTHAAIGSGTALLPASSPLYAYHFVAGDWVGMLHGDLKVGFNDQTGPQGAGKLESQNWLMLMGERQAGPGNLMLRGMVSAEPLTAPHGGFRQLFQTGETYRGRPIFDAQHPHDLFMELSAMYSLPVGERSAVQLYVAPVGEPALGPPAFMHRPSGSENPSAPLGHHGQDSAHITHGVFTLAYQAPRFKVEASAFHGREPDERRAGIELGAIDSWSARLWYTPNRDWAMQVSGGRMKNAETAHPGDIVRLTASIHHDHAWGDGNNVATSLIWGRDHEIFGDSNNYLLESTLTLRDKTSLYTRGELVDKADLLPQQYVPAVIHFKTAPGAVAPENTMSKLFHPGHLPDGGPIPVGYIPVPTQLTFRLAAVTFGAVRDFYDDGRVAVGVGADVTVHARPGVLDARYGEHPVGTHLFLRVRPSGRR